MDWFDSPWSQVVFQYGLVPMIIFWAASTAWNNLIRQLTKMELSLEKMAEVVNHIDRRLLTIEIETARDL
jgi:hypothetical protein